MIFRIEWVYHTPTAGSYRGAVEVIADNEFDACLQLVRRGWNSKIKIVNIEVISMPTQTPIEKYNAHLKAWKQIGYEPSKEDLADIQRLYKVSKKEIEAASPKDRR